MSTSTRIPAIIATSTKIDVLANDSDPDGDPIQITSVSSDANFSQVTATTDGQLIYRLAGASVGDTDEIHYTIADSQGATDSAVAYVKVSPALGTIHMKVSGATADDTTSLAPTYDGAPLPASVHPQQDSTWHVELSPDAPRLAAVGQEMITPPTGYEFDENVTGGGWIKKRVDFDKTGVQNTAELEAPAGPETLTADFTHRPTGARTGETISFDAAPSTAFGTTVSDYTWSWGETGSAGSGQTPTHVYDDPGTYNVTLTLTAADGNTDSVTYPVTVRSPEAPTARFSFSPQGAEPGTDISFDASGSSDPNGRALDYHWTVDDGTLALNQAQFSRSFSERGDHYVELTVSNPDATSTTDVKRVHINQEPLPFANGHLSSIGDGGGEPDIYDLDADLSTDDDGIASYQWQVNYIDDQDGTRYSTPPTDGHFQYSFVDPGQDPSPQGHHDTPEFHLFPKTGYNPQSTYARFDDMPETVEIKLTVTDTAGLSKSTFIRLHPHGCSLYGARSRNDQVCVNPPD